MPALMTCYATAASIYTVVMKMDRKVMIMMLLFKVVCMGRQPESDVYVLFKICSSSVMAQLFHQKSKNTYGSIVF